MVRRRHGGDAYRPGRFNLAYVLMPEHVHVVVYPRKAEYEIQAIRNSLKVPVQRKALRYLRAKAPAFLEHLRDVQPDGTVHHRFWQRCGGYDRNVTDPATLLQMIEYIHNNPVRRGLVSKPEEWIWSSARFYAGHSAVPMRMDALEFRNG